MVYQLKLADELLPILEAYRQATPKQPGVLLQDLFRVALTGMASQSSVTTTELVGVENKYFENSDGLQTQLRVFTPVGAGDCVPLLYWIHGGGTMSGLPEQDDSILYRLCLELGCVVTSVNYRLAPENPFPKPLNDCYEGLVHVTKQASEYGIDITKIAIAGASAGGLLATSCAIRARKENGPTLVHQSLTYPMLDNVDTSQSNKEITNLGVWDSWMNHYGFQCYLTGVAKTEYPNAVPMLADDLSGLPSAFLAVGTMDCLRDEVIEYAQKLAAAGVRTELHIYPGMPHVFDALAPAADSSRDFWQARTQAFKRAFEV